MKTRKYKYVSGTDAGDFFQVVFYDNDTDETPYLLIGNQFEFPNDNKVYFESDEEEIIGNYIVEQANLSHDTLTIKLKKEKPDTIIISINEVIGDHKKAYKVLKIMVPNLKRIKQTC